MVYSECIYLFEVSFTSSIILYISVFYRVIHELNGTACKHSGVPAGKGQVEHSATDRVTVFVPEVYIGGVLQQQCHRVAIIIDDGPFQRRTTILARYIGISPGNTRNTPNMLARRLYMPTIYSGVLPYAFILLGSAPAASSHLTQSALSW